MLLYVCVAILIILDIQLLFLFRMTKKFIAYYIDLNIYNTKIYKEILKEIKRINNV